MYIRIIYVYVDRSQNHGKYTVGGYVYVYVYNEMIVVLIVQCDVV